MKLFLLIFSFFSHFLGAQNLFEDSEFEEIPFETDEDYKDDFLTIEDGQNNSSNGSFLIKDDYYFDYSDINRDEASISVLTGNDTIASTYHMMVFPQAHISYKTAFGQVGVPLRFPIYDNGGGRRNKGFAAFKTFVQPRSQDFRNWYDIQRFVREFRLFNPKDDYFARISRSHATTLGHGELMKNLSPDGLYDEDQAFFYGHTRWSSFRVQGFVGPLPKASLFGLAVRGTPFMTLPYPILRSLNVEASYAIDAFAHNEPVKTDQGYQLSNDRRHLSRKEGTAQGAALSVAHEFSPWWWLSLRPYSTFGNLWFTGLDTGASRYGAGFHLGHEARFNLVPGVASTIHVKTEAALGTSSYVPHYFGSTYGIDRLVFAQQKGSAIPLTKSQFVSSAQPAQFFYLFELGYTFDDMVSALLGYENAHRLSDFKKTKEHQRLSAQVSLVGLPLVRFHAAYQVNDMQHLKELFDFNKSRALISLRGQLKLISFLYFDAWVKHSFGIYDMFASGDNSGGQTPQWLSSRAETRSLNFGLGLEFAMAF